MSLKEKQKFSMLRKVVMIISAGLFIFAVVRLFMITIGEDTHNRLVSVIGAMALLSAPYIIELIFKIRISDFILTFYILYVFFASILGNVVYFYGFVPHYDKVMHSLFGYVGCLVGLIVLCKLEKKNNLNPITVCIVCFAVSLALGAMWEIGEFIGDSFMGQTAQGIPFETTTGESITDVTDTMLDIICNFGGAIVFIVHYIVHIKTKRNLVMGSIIKDFRGPESAPEAEAVTEQI